MKLKLFQRQDLARAALHDGLILSWDTGLGKTWAMFLWALLKVGYLKHFENGVTRLRPNRPILIIAPGDLHQQIADEAQRHFGIIVHRLTDQASFQRLITGSDGLLKLTPDGTPIVPPEFYLTSYTELATNKVETLPDAADVDDPVALLQRLALPVGTPVPRADVLTAKRPKRPTWEERPVFGSVCEFFAWRGIRYRDSYDVLGVDADDALGEVKGAYDREVAALERIRDEKTQAKQAELLAGAWDVVQHLAGRKPGAGFTDLSAPQQSWVVREFCGDALQRYASGIGELKRYPLQRASGSLPEDPPAPDTPCRQVRCVYSPSLADLSYDAFAAVVIDEGVKMKGEDTYVGRGVRSMTPQFRLILTATPVKNRLPDIFRLAWWAAGGRPEAHARWPYADDPNERQKFAETFMVSEHNVTKEANARERGERVSSGRFTKLTAEVCNVHRLWKLIAPIVLRRRKQDTGEAIVSRVRRVIRCEMGTEQKRVYAYHLAAEYLDKNGEKAVGAKLQALRMASTDATSTHLLEQPGNTTEKCPCVERFQQQRVNQSKQASAVELANLEGKLEHGDPRCPKCQGHGRIQLPFRTANPFIPKFQTTLALVKEILERKEQVVVFSAFNDPLDKLSAWLTQANVRHVTLDGRTSQKARGKHAAKFKLGRTLSDAVPPVMLAGVECMAEGHSFHLANNVILIAYSWAFDKFKQALDRVHRMNSAKPVNVYVVLCQGTIDRKLESLVQEKSDSAELVLDGRLIGERTEEVNLSELLKIALREFNEATNTVDENILTQQWPELRDGLAAAMRQWDEGLPVITITPETTIPKRKTMNPNTPLTLANRNPKAGEPRLNPQPSTLPAGNWRDRLLAIQERAKAVAATLKSSNQNVGA